MRVRVSVRVRVRVRVRRKPADLHRKTRMIES